MVAHALNEMRARVDAFVAREQAFTRDTSHELRTPLSVIRSTTSQALNDASLSPASRVGCSPLHCSQRNTWNGPWRACWR